MNTRQSFAAWLNLSPERYGGSSDDNSNNNSDDNSDDNSGLLPIVEYFFMAIEDGAFNEFGVVWQNDAVIYRGKKYYEPCASISRDNTQKIELLFQSLMGFSPSVFSEWGDLSRIPRGKFARAISGVTK